MTVWLVQCASMWEVITRVTVAEDGLVHVSHFGHDAVLSVDDRRMTDMGYEGVGGWAISDARAAILFWLNAKRARMQQDPILEVSEDVLRSFGIR